MSSAGAETSSYWPLLAYLAAVIALAAGMIAVSYVLGERHAGRATGEPFESGVAVVGNARLRFSAKFYLVAMFFVIFDLEAAFIFAWAIAFRAVGWGGYAEVVVFIAILLAGLVYLWRVGALDWAPSRAGRVLLELRQRQAGWETH